MSGRVLLGNYKDDAQSFTPKYGDMLYCKDSPYVIIFGKNKERIQVQIKNNGVTKFIHLPHEFNDLPYNHWDTYESFDKFSIYREIPDMKIIKFRNKYIQLECPKTRKLNTFYLEEWLYCKIREFDYDHKFIQMLFHYKVCMVIRKCIILYDVDAFYCTWGCWDTYKKEWHKKHIEVITNNTHLSSDVADIIIDYMVPKFTDYIASS